jgi:hypothetical protein
MAQEGIDVLTDIRHPDFEQRVTDFSETAKLSRFTKEAGYEHDAPIDFLHALPTSERAQYTKIFNRLYESAAGLQDVFPEPLRKGVVSGARGLLANALFAVQAHVQADSRTHTAIALQNGGELPVDMEGDEPLQILADLDATFRKLHRVVAGPTTRTVLAAEGEGFQYHRFIDVASSLPPSVSLYTRPYEAHTYDDAYEYGRPGVGVEASISYKVHRDDETLIPLSKYAPADDIISIRLDLEHTGALSLDVGSVLGKAHHFGTRVGRLLGWGNALRAEAAGKKVDLNHVKHTLDQQYAVPAAFANLAYQTRAAVHAIAMSPAERRLYASGVVSRPLARALLAS